MKKTIILGIVIVLLATAVQGLNSTPFFDNYLNLKYHWCFNDPYDTSSCAGSLGDWTFNDMFNTIETTPAYDELAAFTNYSGHMYRAMGPTLYTNTTFIFRFKTNETIENPINIFAQPQTATQNNGRSIILYPDNVVRLAWGNGAERYNGSLLANLTDNNWHTFIISATRQTPLHLSFMIDGQNLTSYIAYPTWDGTELSYFPHSNLLNNYDNGKTVSNARNKSIWYDDVIFYNVSYTPEFIWQYMLGGNILIDANFAENASTIYENTQEKYRLNLTVKGYEYFNNYSGTFYFNGTEYGLSRYYNTSDTWVFETDLNIPSNKEHMTAYNVNNTYFEINTTYLEINNSNLTYYFYYNQSVGFFTNVSDCSNGPSDVTYSFVLANEQSVKNETGFVDATIELTYNNISGTSSTETFALNFSDNTNQHDICIFPSYKNITADITIQSKGNTTNAPTVTKTYFIVNDTVENITTIHNLYLLNESESNNIYFHVQDENFLALADVYIHVYRQYVGEGLYRVVEISKTDYDGEALLHLQSYDVLYYYLMYLDGELIYATSPAAVTRTDYYFKPLIGATFMSEYTDIQGFLYDFTFTNVTDTTSTCTFTWQDTLNAAPGGVCMKIRYVRGGLSNIRFDTCVDSSNGALTHTVNTSDVGEYICTGYIKGHNSLIGSGSVVNDPDFNIFGNAGLIGAFMIVGSFGMLNLIHPIVIILFTLFGLGVAMTLNLWGAAAVGFGVLLVIGVIFIVRSKF